MLLEISKWRDVHRVVDWRRNLRMYPIDGADVGEIWIKARARRTLRSLRTGRASRSSWSGGSDWAGRPLWAGWAGRAPAALLPQAQDEIQQPRIAIDQRLIRIGIHHDL